MKLKIIDGEFSICKLRDTCGVEMHCPYTFLSVTEDEISLVCRSDRLPPNHTHAENGWRMLRIVGELDFSLVGILSRISTALAEAKVGIFAVSTYNTDYILLKKEQLSVAKKALLENGWELL